MNWKSKFKALKALETLHASWKYIKVVVFTERNNFPLKETEYHPMAEDTLFSGKFDPRNVISNDALSYIYTLLMH